MSRLCPITGKKPLKGHRVSHANNKTNFFFLPNLHNVTLRSATLDRTFSFRISARGLRTIDKHGGFDGFLTAMPKRRLNTEMWKIKKAILEKQAAA
jgi:large subunit ribosomal protein L28